MWRGSGLKVSALSPASGRRKGLNTDNKPVAIAQQQENDLERSLLETDVDGAGAFRGRGNRVTDVDTRARLL